MRHQSAPMGTIKKVTRGGVFTCERDDLMEIEYDPDHYQVITDEDYHPLPGGHVIDPEVLNECLAGLKEREL